MLVAASRSGSTFLQTALSNHSEIGCDRYEPLAAGSPYLEYLVPPADPWSLCHALLSRPGYKATVIKLSYRHFRDNGGAKFLEAIEADRIIHLTRANTLRIVFSAVVNTMARVGLVDVPNHAYEPVMVQSKIVIPMFKFIEECDEYEAATDRMRGELLATRLPILSLTYENIIYGALSHPAFRNRVVHATAELICRFLRVREEDLFGITAQLHPGPLSLYIENWREFCEAIEHTPYAPYLEKELAYETQWNARSNL